VQRSTCCHPPEKFPFAFLPHCSGLRATDTAHDELLPSAYCSGLRATDTAHELLPSAFQPHCIGLRATDTAHDELLPSAYCSGLRATDTVHDDYCPLLTAAVYVPLARPMNYCPLLSYLTAVVYVPLTRPMMNYCPLLTAVVYVPLTRSMMNYCPLLTAVVYVPLTRPMNHCLLLSYLTAAVYVPLVLPASIVNNHGHGLSIFAPLSLGVLEDADYEAFMAAVPDQPLVGASCKGDLLFMLCVVPSFARQINRSGLWCV